MKNLFAFLFTIACLSANAQDSDSESKSNWSFKVGVIGNSVPVYSISGTDTSYMNKLALAPFIAVYYNRVGLQYNYNIVTSGSQPGAYMQALTASYSNYEKGPFDVDLSFSHLFYSGNKSIPFSPIKNEVYGFIDYKKSWLRPLLSTGIEFGQKADNTTATQVNVAAGFNHSFEWEPKSGFKSISISPSLTLNAGTSEYFSFNTITKPLVETYNQKSAKGKGRARRNGGSTSGSTTTTTQNPYSQFSLNTIELGTYSNFAIGNFEIIPSTSLFFPINQKISSSVSGYFQLQLDYKF